MMKWTLALTVITAIVVGYSLYDGFDPKSLKGKNVVITGASMGIGEQMAYHYARMGARVLIVARSEDRMKAVVERCREVGDKNGVYLYHVADLSKLNETEAVIQAAVKKLGSIDYLLLNHVYSVLSQWYGTKQNLTSLHNMMDINFFAYVHLASHALPVLQKSKGSIVVVSSLAGRISQPHIMSYSSSKFALEGFFSGFRKELYMRDTDVSVTMCFIGLVDTEAALRNLKEYGFNLLLAVVRTAKASEVAYDIIRGGALRVPEVFSPYLDVKLGLWLQVLAPNLMEKTFGILYQQT
jgi:corticosteroid 11-beta-dehydrogenase isozyme 1